jgi:hypothetical protein
MPILQVLLKGLGVEHSLRSEPHPSALNLFNVGNKRKAEVHGTAAEGVRVIVMLL